MSVNLSLATNQATGAQIGTDQIAGFVRFSGHPMGVIASDSRHVNGGALTADGCDKLKRHLDVCDLFQHGQRLGRNRLHHEHFRSHLLGVPLRARRCTVTPGEAARVVEHLKRTKVILAASTSPRGWDRS